MISLRDRLKEERKSWQLAQMVEKTLGCLGRGFDVNNDFKAKYCKGTKRLVVLNKEKTELVVPGFGVFPDVSADIKCDKGDHIRYRSDFLEFTQMSELLNQRSSIAGKVPSGIFNSSFGFPGDSWAHHASRTKCLAYDGYFISLFNLRIDRYPLIISDDVAGAVPSTWDPVALSRFIEKFGTHVIIGLSMGGQDAVFVRQDQTSTLPTCELKEHLDSLGNQLFTGACTLLPLHWKNKDVRRKPPEAFNVFKGEPQLGDGFTSFSSKKGITVICAKRGGVASAQSHSEWLLTVPSAPDVINFTFIPITSLLKDVPGKGFLSHAINLYLRYKPPLSDLEYFLDFQSPKSWAPMLNDHPLGPSSNRSMPTTALQFNMMGPKLCVNTTQVIVGTRPVTGMRLHLEGKKNNRLAVHLEHLSDTPDFLGKRIGADLLRRELDVNQDFYVPVQKKKFSHVCTAPVKYDPEWHAASGDNAAFIVTGAQLQVKNHEGKNVLHLALMYSRVSDCIVDRSKWEQGPLTTSSTRSGFFSALSTTFSTSFEVERLALEAKRPAVVMDSAVFPRGPPVPEQNQKLLKFVDTSHICKGAQDIPGHWLVTGAKLEVKKERICLQVKFSLLGIPSS